MNPQRLLLTTDFSECSERAFATAAEIARRHGAKIDLVNVSGALPPFAFGHSGGGLTLAEFQQDIRERLKEQAADAVFEGVEVETHMLEGQSAEVVAEFQKRTGNDLLVTSTHGSSGFSRLFIGSFAERLVRLVACPVLTVRAKEGATKFSPKRILVPYDHSDFSKNAFETVRELAKQFGAKVLLFHVVHHELAPVADFPMTSAAMVHPPSYWEESISGSTTHLETVANEAFEDLDVECDSILGDPLREIVHKAETSDTDLIVLSTHGRSGLGHVLLGSVAERVVRKAPCSVLTIRPDA